MHLNLTTISTLYEELKKTKKERELRKSTYEQMHKFSIFILLKSTVLLIQALKNN